MNRIVFKIVCLCKSRVSNAYLTVCKRKREKDKNQGLHTNATLLIYIGVNITTVQKLLGHKSIKTTQLYSAILDQTIVHDLGKCFTGKID